MGAVDELLYEDVFCAQRRPLLFFLCEVQGVLNLVGLLGTTAVNGSVIRLYL